MMTIVDLLQHDGIDPVHASGDEWHSPCPKCGGRDRFSSFPNQRNANGKFFGGRYHCRKCSMGTGDAVAYLQKMRGLSFRDACKYLEIDPGVMPEHRTVSRQHVWEPEPPKAAPPALWQAKAERFTAYCVKQLQSNSEAMAWLQNERGLSLETIRAARLGWNPVDWYLRREDWGLSLEINQKTGKVKKLWIPTGLSIPSCPAAVVNRIRIRRSQPPMDGGSRYWNVGGSNMQPMTIWADQQAVVILESELDCLFINQECSDLIGAVALGSAALKPDAELHRRLTTANMILCSLDADTAGAKAAIFWKQYPGFKRWMTIRGKDVTEQWRAGIPVRTWVAAGLS